MQHGHTMVATLEEKGEWNNENRKFVPLPHDKTVEGRRYKVGGCQRTSPSSSTPLHTFYLLPSTITNAIVRANDDLLQRNAPLLPISYPKNLLKKTATRSAPP